MIYQQKPKFPARIYASTNPKIAVCLSEFTMPALLDRFIARSILAWAKSQKCSLVISPCGVPSMEEEEGERKEMVMFGVGSTDRTRQMLKSKGVPLLQYGVVPGITGALLNEGKWNSSDVIALLVEADPEIPDARAAATVVEAIQKLLPHLNLDVSPLYEEAERIEARLKTLREQAKPAQSPNRPAPYA
jgi:uncharacterized protein